LWLLLVPLLSSLINLPIRTFYVFVPPLLVTDQVKYTQIKRVVVPQQARGQITDGLKSGFDER